MTSQKISSCKDSVKEHVLKRPVTFMKLVSETQCATETVEKYLSQFLKEMLVKEKKGKFRIIYPAKINTEIIKFYELMLNPTIKAITVVLVKSENALSQIELVAITGKSNPSISRGLKELIQLNLIQRNYHAPFSTYELINKNKIIELLHNTYPEIYHNLDEFELEHPQPKLFLERLK